LAKSRLTGDAPDEALVLLAAALEADPSSGEARTLMSGLLAKTRWHLPELTLEHHLSIEHIDFAPPSSLWVCLKGESLSTVRWNLDAPAIENILFPIQALETRAWIGESTHQSAVIERGAVTLLCNAQSLKPIRDLGPLPDFLTPSAVVVFSADGLLLAHPSLTKSKDHALVWHLRDAASGEILRSSEPAGPDHARPLAAWLSRKSLRVLHADGSLLEMPVSPGEPVCDTPAATPLTLVHAQFSHNGNAALTLKNPGPHHRPLPFVMPFEGPPDSSLEPASLLERFPWSLHPGLWTDLLGEPALGAIKMDERCARILSGGHAPVHSASAITALTLVGDRILTGEKDGTLTVFHSVPPPLEIKDPPKPAVPDATALAALGKLAHFLAGCTYDDGGQTCTRSATDLRLKAFHQCDFAALDRSFPELDFRPILRFAESFHPRSAPPEAMLPLWDRLARADPSGGSWQVLLEKSKDLSSIRWHRDLTGAVLARTSKAPVGADASPWLAPLRLTQIFTANDPAAMAAAIEAAPGKGGAAAKALELSLASTQPEWIQACLTKSADLPPLLRRIADSRIAWLQQRKADALSVWPDVFPEMKQVRLTEDWDGWEQADFSQALENLNRCVGEELRALEVPPNATPEQRQAVAARLADPATILAVGRKRFASACLKAALVLAAFKDETPNTFALAQRARELGEQPAPCLRAEAISLTGLGDYQKAHARWITLITEFPVADQQPGDYAEAAYTAFENSDPRQAMAILTTGLHRFPNDSNFALRAGWVALLTGNAERAYRFLLTGRQIGYPPEKIENATALLAIAAGQTGAAEDAAAYYQDLIRLDPAWEDPATLESLEWPDELKASLRQLVP
jgi:tetratricopeptide (TPR) repeat protein